MSKKMTLKKATSDFYRMSREIKDEEIASNYKQVADWLWELNRYRHGWKQGKNTKTAKGGNA